MRGPSPLATESSASTTLQCALSMCWGESEATDVATLYWLVSRWVACERRSRATSIADGASSDILASGVLSVQFHACPVVFPSREPSRMFVQYAARVAGIRNVSRAGCRNEGRARTIAEDTRLSREFLKAPLRARTSTVWRSGSVRALGAGRLRFAGRAPRMNRPSDYRRA